MNLGNKHFKPLIPISNKHYRPLMTLGNKHYGRYHTPTGNLPTQNITDAGIINDYNNPDTHQQPHRIVDYKKNNSQMSKSSSIEKQRRQSYDKTNKFY